MPDTAEARFGQDAPGVLRALLASDAGVVFSAQEQQRQFLIHVLIPLGPVHHHNKVEQVAEGRAGKPKAAVWVGEIGPNRRFVIAEPVAGRFGMGNAPVKNANAQGLEQSGFVFATAEGPDDAGQQDSNRGAALVIGVAG